MLELRFEPRQSGTRWGAGNPMPDCLIWCPKDTWASSKEKEMAYKSRQHGTAPSASSPGEIFLAETSFLTATVRKTDRGQVATFSWGS